MKKKPVAIRTPIRRQRAEDYLLVTLLSFALSVSLTRFFLYMTGYPSIGGSTLHIAHVLWGGLILFIASLLPLLLANRYIYYTSAVLSGIGVGLFIDEVGKFITRSNDYFYPWAAPIIYVFFLLVVLLYMRIRRPTQESVRADLYYILEDLQEVLDHDLSQRERDDIVNHLERVKRLSTHPDLVDLAKQIEDFITNQNILVIPDQVTWWDRLRQWFDQHEKKWLSRNRYRAILSGALAAVGVWAMVYPFYILMNAFSTSNLEPILADLLADRVISGPTSASWYTAMLTLELITGLALLISSVLFTLHWERKAFTMSYLGLLVSLTMVNVLVFYFDQFSTIITSTVQFFVMLVILRYRYLYLRPRNLHP